MYRTGKVNLPLHEGKDGVPFSIDKIGMDVTIQIINQGIHETSVGKKVKLQTLKKPKNITR